MKRYIFIAMICLFCMLTVSVSAETQVLEPGMSAVLKGDDSLYGIGYDIPAGSYYFSCGDEEAEDCKITLFSMDYFQIQEDSGFNIYIYGGEYGHPVRVWLREGTMLKVSYSPVTITVAEPIVFTAK